MAKVTRRLICEGGCYVIECAVRGDGVTSPAASFLDHLSQGTWVEDPDFGDDFPDDAQISDYDKILTFFQVLADEGEPCYAGAVNDLNNGIWEFKLGAKRLSFFDTPGDGSYKPKPRPATAADASRGKYYWFPDFDEYVRLGHAFPKTGQRTTDDDLELTLRVREEDVEHDRLR
ncbi:hypothetical protein [Actinoplanes couchii]|uniref:Uncharacterized protein n=1 Tax=Actinoplanes couchii TaxID=403638 RepID=A0ABQ3X778_9ACTN|nr:hypothetical protein [Actinoplanes couchii]MDR6322193.1 hypothetical protein [Actinoplanes couchii]GID54358.1 hypothetical protein Aco03nite_027620 [Actinoplanes couchii]